MAEKSTYDAITFAVAFDIGTRTTRFAMSTNIAPHNIIMRPFAGANCSVEAPTSVLVDDEKEFKAFGIEAEDMYAKLDKKQKDKGWALFRRFKDQINHLTNVSNNTEVVDISQKIKVPAIKLYSMVINYLKEMTLTDIRSMVKYSFFLGDEIQEDKIDYAITVPDFWHESVRRMVRNAAFEVGIAAGHLKLILESDAATVWCRHDPDLMEPVLQTSGKKQIVVNMGDLETEITAHEVTKRNTLKQLTKSVVTEFGGQFVDNQLLIFFEKIFGKETMEMFKTDFPGEYIEFVDSFALIKRRITLELSENLCIRLPIPLCVINESKTKNSGRDFRSLIKSERYLELVSDQLILDPKFVRITFFHNNVVNLVYTIQEHPNIDETDYMLCMGEFSVCTYVLDVLAVEFPDKKIVRPKESELSVVKGAVICRHRPGVFGRKAKFTYGISKHVLFDENLHSGHKKCLIGDNWCTEVFHKYVEKGQEISYDFQKTEYGLLPMEGDRRSAKCSLYQSLKESPVFVSDQECSLVATFIHKFPHEQELSNREYDLTIRFLFDEIRITFLHKKSGETETKTFPF